MQIQKSILSSFQSVLVIFMLGLMPLSSLSAKAFADNTLSSTQVCLNIVKTQQYDALVLACTDTYGKPLNKAIRDATYFSYLGTFDNLSESGTLLLQQAEAGHATAQYLMGALQFTMVPSSKKREQYLDEIEQRALSWFFKSAEQGNTNAMLAYIQRVIRIFSLPTAEEHKHASRFAKMLRVNEGPIAEPYKAALKNIPHKDNWQAHLNKTLDKLSTLSTKRIQELAAGFLYGRIKFDSGDKRVVSPEIKTSPDAEKRLRLLKYLDEYREDGMAANELANKYFDNVERYEYYFKKAIVREYAPALRRLGLYLACDKQINLAKKYLIKAKSFGNTDAEDDLLELDEYGSIYRCPSKKLRPSFIKALPK